MLNQTEVSRHIKGVASQCDKTNEARSQSRLKLTPSSRVSGRIALLEMNRSHDRKMSTSVERLKLGTQRLKKEATEIKEAKPISNVRQVTASRSLHKYTTPTDKPRSGPIANKSEPSLGAPKKRDLHRLMQTSMKYGEKIAKIMEASSISPKKSDMPKMNRPDLEEFSLTDAMQKAVLTESRSVYAQVRELQMLQKLRRRNSVEPDSSHSTKRQPESIQCSSGLNTQRSDEYQVESLKAPSSLKRLPRRQKSSIAKWNP